MDSDISVPFPISRQAYAPGMGITNGMAMIVPQFFLYVVNVSNRLMGEWSYGNGKDWYCVGRYSFGHGEEQIAGTLPVHAITSDWGQKRNDYP